MHIFVGLVIKYMVYVQTWPLITIPHIYIIPVSTLPIGNTLADIMNISKYSLRCINNN